MNCFVNESEDKNLQVSTKNYRETQNRIFANTDLQLDKIKFYGFDMDYTIVEYLAPEFDTLCFNLLKERLVSVGYPSEVAKFEYDSSFPVRGLWFDFSYGNLLKVDTYCNIFACVHGFNFLNKTNIDDIYPNGFIQLDNSRVYVLDTMFSLPEIYMLAILIDSYTSSDKYKQDLYGIRIGDSYLSYKTLFQDVRSNTEWIHREGDLKRQIVDDLAHYIRKDHRLALLLSQLKKKGRNTFLLTNSDYWYTNSLMSFLLGSDKKSWKEYFDYIIVDSRKPLFFGEGSALKQVNEVTGTLKIGTPLGPLIKGQVYSGGSCDLILEKIGAKGKDILYCGDHIYGDIVKSKKISGWRTFLVVPELNRELHVWTNKRDLFQKLQGLRVQLGNAYQHLDNSEKANTDKRNIQNVIQNVIYELDMAYGNLGSLLRSGSRRTFYSSQLGHYSDIYAATILNLLYYPLNYMFRAPTMLLPHETTEDEEVLVLPEKISSLTLPTSSL